MNYTAIKTEELESIWGDFAPFIEVAVEYSDGAWLIEDVEKKLFQGEATLWIAYNGSPKAAGVTWFEEFPQKKDLVIAFAGGEMDSIKGLMEMGKSFAKANQCDGIRCYGRRGWSRALEGFREISTISRIEL